MGINPSDALYIKLGHNGEWEQGCLLEHQTIRLGYDYVDHDACLRGDWDRVQKDCGHVSTDPGAITRHINQVRKFYTAGEDVLWVTFHANKLWYCFSERKIRKLDDGSKIRPVIGTWKSSDEKGIPLSMDQLSGSLLSMQGFRGTICSVRESDYLIHRINAELPKTVINAENALSELEERLKVIIKSLYHKDFEILIDLIFRQAGWQRVSILGKTQKILDLDLLSPITNERYAVQVKSKAGLKVFEKYQHHFEDMNGYSKFYFVVHSPLKDLDKTAESEDFKLLFPHDIARLAIKYGLGEWIISKARA